MEESKSSGRSCTRERVAGAPREGGDQEVRLAESDITKKVQRGKRTLSLRGAKRVVLYLIGSGGGGEGKLEGLERREKRRRRGRIRREVLSVGGERQKRDCVW